MDKSEYDVIVADIEDEVNKSFQLIYKNHRSVPHGYYSGFLAGLKKAFSKFASLVDKNYHKQFINNMDYTHYITKKDHETNEGNIYPCGIDYEEFTTFAIRYLLDDDWYVADPLSGRQINQVALEKILHKYSKKFRKECKKFYKNKRR